MTHELVQLALACNSPFLFNSQEHNLISLEKYIKKTGKGRHGNHPKYNDWLQILLDNTLQQFENDKNRRPDECEAKELLLLMVQSLTNIINAEKELTINQLGKKYLEE